jgi:hypothetical protein
MKRYLPIMVFSAALLITLTAAFGVYHKRNENMAPPGDQTVNPLTLIQSSSVPSSPTSPSSSTPVADNLSALQGWAKFRDEKYKFEIQHPQGWPLVSKVGLPALPYTPVQEPIAFYTAMDVPTQGAISAPIIVAVYDKPSTAIIEWLSKAFGTDLSKVSKGGVTTILEKAYAFDQKGILTYNQSLKNEMILYEVGHISYDNTIHYATVFTKENTPYAYEVSFSLSSEIWPYIQKSIITEYVETYKQIVSTFQNWKYIS